MRCARRRCYLSVAVAVAAAGVVAVPTVTPPAPVIQARELQLTSGDSAASPLGDGTALVIGGSGIPIPADRYVDAADTLYLAPRGFTGTPQALDTPEGFYPTTGVNSLTADASEAQGSKILDGAILGQIATGQVDSENPVVVFGYSQSSAFSTMTMQQLTDQGVPSDDVHFVLVGDTAAPDGGLLERFALPGGDFSVPSFGVTFGDPTPADLYPTDIYTLEYDGFADFPQYPINPIADLNAFAGMIYEHLTYLTLDSDQIQHAIPLDTVGDTLTNYYMIPVNDLPLLDPLRLIPVVGKPAGRPAATRHESAGQIWDTAASPTAGAKARRTSRLRSSCSRPTSTGTTLPRPCSRARGKAFTPPSPTWRIRTTTKFLHCSTTRRWLHWWMPRTPPA